VRRRDLLALLAAAAASPVRAAEKIWRIGFLDGGPEAVRRRSFEVFRRGMAERGYVEEKNVVYDARYAEGHFDRLPQRNSSIGFRSSTLFVTTRRQAAWSPTEPIFPGNSVRRPA
jgi:hypothetical protein